MRVYIIGASGFLGRHLAQHFGGSEVVQAAPSFSDSSANSDLWQANVLKQMCEFSPDLVLIPGASQIMSDDSSAIHSLAFSNCILPCLVAHRLLELFPMAKLVVFGSSWQFSDSDHYRPFNLYAASKQAGRDMLVHYSLRGLKILEIIMFDTYSEHDSRRKLLTLLKEACMSGEVIGTTPGDQEIDLIHIEDVCTGVEHALRELEEWDATQGVLTLGLGSGHPISVKELILRVENIFGKPLHARIGERPYRPREVMKVLRSYCRPRGWEILRREFQK